MKSYLKKLLVFVMAVFIIIGMFAGCGSKATETRDDSTVVNTVAETSKDASQAGTASASGSNLPIRKEPITFKFFLPWYNNANKVMNNLSENEVIKELEKRTNIQFDFIHPAGGQEAEALNILLASHDYPDLIRDTFKSYNGGADAAIKDGILINMNDLIDKYAPNYLNMINSIPGYDKIVKSDAGTYVWFMSVYSPQEFIHHPFTGLAIRQDWLDKLGLKMPETVDDWYVVLKAFKDKMNCEAPLGLSEIFTDQNQVRTQAFVGSFGAAYSFYQDNGKVKYGPIQPQFKDFLSTFSKWYKEGLIDKDIATHSVSKNILPMAADGRCGAMILHESTFASLYKLNNGKDPGYNMEPAPYPSLKKGEKCKYMHDNLGVGGVAPVFITTACKHPEEAVKFFDYIYSKEGNNLCTFGTEEGRTYNIVDGKHVLTDLIQKNPDGLSFESARNKYTLPNLTGAWNWEYEEPRLSPQAKKATWDVWLNSATAENVIPDLITMNADDSTAYANIMNQVDSYSQEMILKFIMGIEPISNFDKFVDQVKKMGIENAEAIKQGALDRFKNR